MILTFKKCFKKDMILFDFDNIKTMGTSPVTVIVSVDRLYNVSFVFKGIVSQYNKATVILRRVTTGGMEKSYDEIIMNIDNPQSGVKYNTNERIRIGETTPVCYMLILDDEKYRKL